jgi:hypothetical protein
MHWFSVTGPATIYVLRLINQSGRKAYMPKPPVKQAYGNESISALKGADRVRKRPGVIFGSDGLEGCQHAVFEILSNSIDESRRATET